MTSDARRAAARLADLLRFEHQAMADFLLALADFDRYRSWAALGHASLWAFLHHDLGLSAGAAFQRKEAAALLRRAPAVEAPLRDGRLCLSSMSELAKVLTPQNQADVLPRFFGKSAREAREEVAAIAPQEALPSRVVVTAVASAPRVKAPLLTSETGMTHPGRGSPAGPTQTPSPVASQTQTPSPVASQTQTPSPSPSPSQTPAPAAAAAAIPAPAATSIPTAIPAAASNASPIPTTSATATAAPASTATRTAVEPLTADLRRLHITVSRRFLQKLDAARCARAHANPSGSIEAVLEEALDLLLIREAKRLKGATTRPAAAPRAAAAEHVPARVRREVWARDEGRCQWPLEQGGVCGSTWQLELDHVQPKARGGPPTAANLRLLCHAHNAEAARRIYGDAWMARARGLKGARGFPRDDGPPALAKGPSGVAPQA